MTNGFLGSSYEKFDNTIEVVCGFYSIIYIYFFFQDEKVILN